MEQILTYEYLDELTPFGLLKLSRDLYDQEVIEYCRYKLTDQTKTNVLTFLNWCHRRSESNPEESS